MKPIGEKHLSQGMGLSLSQEYRPGFIHSAAEAGFVKGGSKCTENGELRIGTKNKNLGNRRIYAVVLADLWVMGELIPVTEYLMSRTEKQKQVKASEF